MGRPKKTMKEQRNIRISIYLTAAEAARVAKAATTSGHINDASWARFVVLGAAK